MSYEPIVIFGETEKTLPKELVGIESLPELIDKLGNPKEDTLAIPMCIQSLLYERPVLFYQVSQEGQNQGEYLHGLTLMQKEGLPKLAGMALPQVSSDAILDLALLVAEKKKFPLIISEQDLYDLITS